MSGIAVAHSLFNTCARRCAAAGGLLEKLCNASCRIRAAKSSLLSLKNVCSSHRPSRSAAAVPLRAKWHAAPGEALHMALTTFENYSPELAESIRENESRCDRYEDELGDIPGAPERSR